MSSYEANVSVYAELETESLILVFDGQEFVVDKEDVSEFIGAIFEAGMSIGVIECLEKRGLH